MNTYGAPGVETHSFHQLRRPQDHRTAGSDGQSILYDSQPVIEPPAKFRDISANQSIPQLTDKQINAKTFLPQESTFSQDPHRALPGLHERLVSTQETQSRVDSQLLNQSLLLRQYNPMEHDRFRDQQQSPSQDQLPAGANLAYGSVSDHMSTATLNVNSTGSGPSSDLSAPNYAPRGRPPRLGSSGAQHRSMHTHQPHGTSMLPNLSPNNTPYYAAQQTQGQNTGQTQQQQQQQQQQHHYMSQPMSPTIYYPTFQHMHQQTTSPNAYNVNQGYMSLVPTSAGPSMPVTPYAYSHPYTHVSDHTMHPFAYPGVGSMPLYPDVDPQQQQQQQMQNHGPNMEMMSGYVPILATTGPSYGYSIPAYAPTGGSIFSPQYSGGHPYTYNPQHSQPFPAGYAQGHQGSRPPPLSLSQHQAPGPGPSQIGLEHPHGPPSPLNLSNMNQTTSGGYSPIVVAPSPGGMTPGNTRPDYVPRNGSGSNPFGLGLNPGTSASLSGYGSSGAGSSGDALGPPHSTRRGDSNSSSIPSDLGQANNTPDAEGVRTQGSTSTQRDRAATLSRGDQPEQQQQQGSSKGDRSDWVMWVGNVPGDASLNELYTFFGQGPPIPEEERKLAEYYPTEIPQLEGVALEPTPPDEKELSADNVGVGGLSGVVSVFLISRSNCAFVNYVSEASLQRGVDYFNGRPLRNPQVDPRCPKLVCRVRKKGDDVKAGVGGQRGVGTHTRWVKDKKAAEARTAAEMEDGSAERPPFVHGGPAGAAKKSSSGSSVSYASTNSGMLQKNFPIRYFILKSLTQHDLDLSVERGLWATQIHNQEVLDQAYRTSQTVYLIFGVNKSGEFFGYAKMDGPISQVERNPSIEWAARDSATNPNSAKPSPVAIRGTPSQPTIEEAPDQEETKGLNLAPPEVENQKPSMHSSDDASTTHAHEKQYDPHRFSSVPLGIAEPTRHSMAGEYPARRDGEKAHTLPHHQISEPIQRSRHEARQQDPSRPSQQSEPSPVLPEQAYYSPTRIVHPSMARLFPGASLQDSPDPLTPGEDQQLHSLENAKPLSSVEPRPQPLRSQKDTQGNPHSNDEPERDLSGFSIASAPAVMSGGHKPLSASTPIVPSDTWDERRKGINVWSKEHSIEEEPESSDDVLPVIPTTHSLPPENMLAPVRESDENAPTMHLELPPAPMKLSHLDTPGIHPDPDPTPSSKPANTAQTEEPPASDPLVVPHGREEGWGTPFKIKWIRTNPLPFQRTRQLRNPWNHDREIKVSRDGTEVEPGVGQRLLEEWDRPDAVTAIGGPGPRSPTTLGGPPSPIQSFAPRTRGRGRGAVGGWQQRDTGQ